MMVLLMSYNLTMNICRSFLIIVLLFVTTSVVAEQSTAPIVDTQLSTIVDKYAPITDSSSSTAQQSEYLHTDDEPPKADILPSLMRMSSTLFLSVPQVNPDYVLKIELMPTVLSASLFKNLINPPDLEPWFLFTHHHASSSRLSGWKDSNLLYRADTTTHA